MYDGHGVKGAEAVETVKKLVHAKLNEDRKKISRMRDAYKVENYFRDLFRSIQKKMNNQNDYALSGTCAVCVLVVENKLFCINVGDSRCVLGQRKGGETKKEGERIAIEMSIDQKPTRDDEQKRIVERGGEVSEKIMGVPRVFRKNDDEPGLAVARSIGDNVAHDVGVSCDPEVFEKELDGDDSFVVIGSDGIWDVLSSCEVVGYVFNYLDEYKADKEDTVDKSLVFECRHRWEILNMFKTRYASEVCNKNQDNEGNKERNNNQNSGDIDDITTCIFVINQDRED